MIKGNIEKVLKERIRISEETQDNWDYGIEQCRNEMINILSSNISETIQFIKNECTDEEFYCLGEVFEEVAKKTQSREFVQALRNRLSNVSSETYCQQNSKLEYMRNWVDYSEYVRSISMDIDYAAGQIDE